MLEIKDRAIATGKGGAAVLFYPAHTAAKISGSMVNGITRIAAEAHEVALGEPITFSWGRSSRVMVPDLIRAIDVREMGLPFTQFVDDIREFIYDWARREDSKVAEFLKAYELGDWNFRSGDALDMLIRTRLAESDSVWWEAYGILLRNA